MSFFNTTSLFGPELQEAKAKALSQDEMVLEAFRRIDMPMGPSMVYKYLLNKGQITTKTPITSLRRSITTLTKEGRLIKTGKLVMGNFGQKEHQWRLL